MPSWFVALVGIAAIAAGAVASVTGFGIGSLLTPAFSLRVEPGLAVAVVSIPHVVGTAVRFWRLRHHVDRHVLVRFGLMSAAGGLAGALFQSVARSPWLFLVFGSLLLFVSFTEWTGLSGRMRFRGPVAWTAGLLSGFLGGLVGNQGGIRSAALFGFDMPKTQFVATATAIGLIVDGARMPVYLATYGARLLPLWPAILVATAGTIAGTFVGYAVLGRVPESRFRRVVAAVLAVLGVSMVARAF